MYKRQCWPTALSGCRQFCCSFRRAVQIQYMVPIQRVAASTVVRIKFFSGSVHNARGLIAETRCCFSVLIQREQTCRSPDYHSLVVSPPPLHCLSVGRIAGVFPVHWWYPTHGGWMFVSTCENTGGRPPPPPLTRW